jgi:hypothetical protein
LITHLPEKRGFMLTRPLASIKAGEYVARLPDFYYLEPNAFKKDTTLGV